MSLKLDWTDSRCLEIGAEDANDDGKLVLVEDDIKSLYDEIRDGFCAICLTDIPQESELCCECLNRIAAYHQAQHACLTAGVYQ